MVWAVGEIQKSVYGLTNIPKNNIMDTWSPANPNFFKSIGDGMYIETKKIYQ